MAAPGTKIYGRLSVTLGSYCSATKLFTIGRGAFQPPPKVESAFVRLVPDRARISSVNDRAVFDELVRAAFGQRRKTLRNALKKHAVEPDFEATGIDPALRPERLSEADYVALANQVAMRRGCAIRSPKP